MTTTPTRATPIETRYAGCRFRSRLEARWAVFFDHMDIPWVYEPNGYTISTGRRYLPDFLLTDCGTWVEVKGDPARYDRILFMRAAADLPRHSGAGEDFFGLAVLGNIPDPGRLNGEPGWPMFLADLVTGRHCGFDAYHKQRRPWLLDGTGRPTPDDLLRPPTAGHLSATTRAAYTAARSARFEHGQNG